MSLSTPSLRLLTGLKQALRQCRAERQRDSRRWASTDTIQYPSLQPRYPPPTPGFRTSQTTNQNRSEQNLKRIPVVPPPRSTLKTCPDPIATLTSTQLRTLDPNGARTRLFSPANPERVQPGDILLVRHKSGDPWSGVVLNIRRRHSVIDTAVLLRGQLTRVGVEMWVKVYSPNVEGIEVVQRKMGRRARRAKLYYLRQPRHDVGSVENLVKAYVRQKAGGPVAGSRVKGRDAGSHKKKKKAYQKGRN